MSDPGVTMEQAMAMLDRLDEATLSVINASSTWAPLPGPQTRAWLCEADELFYGGAAGGGKTDFVCGLALEEHIVSIVYRREAPQLAGITDRLTELLGGRDLFHGGDRTWRPGGGKQIEYGSMPNPGDEQKYQGRPHDLIVFDEVTQFAEFQYRYLQTWNRSVVERQRCRVVATGNPPTTPEGLWVTQYWGPWLDSDHPLYGKVKEGELVWYVTVDGHDIIVADGGPYQRPDTGVWVMPRSRTYISAQVEDNPFLMRTGYADSLEALPEPLRSQMRLGDFSAGQSDDEWQCIPSAWVDAAQIRWRAREHDPHGPMSAMGVDCARGGKDAHVMVPRWGSFFGEPISVPGIAVPDGPTGAGLVVQHLRNGATCNVDVVGIGTSVVDALEGLGLEVNAVHGAAASVRTDKTGKLRMSNLRAQLYWGMREMLDPTNPDPIALPPSTSLKSDLCAPRYKVGPRGVQVEDKESIQKRLHRSPDEGDACVYAAHEYLTEAQMPAIAGRAAKDQPYRREAAAYNRPSADGSTNGWGSWSDAINYPED